MIVFLAALIAAQESSIDVLERQVAGLEPRLVNLDGAYLRTELYDKDAGVKQRVSDGEILFLLGDYARACVVLYDVVSEPRNAIHPLYDRALFFLGESSFHARNFVGARAYFQQLISRSDKTFLFDAFERLIEIAETLQDYSGVEEKVAEMRQAGAGVLRADVAYLYGKSLSRRLRSKDAVAQLELIKPDHKFHFRARYIIGGEYVRAQKLGEAATEFTKIIEAKDPMGLGADPKDVLALKEVTYMALGRVYAEQGRISDAMEAYQTIARDSPHLPQALYEIAWMYVTRSTYATLERERSLLLRRALQAIDLMLLSQDDKVLVPKATVLKGNVLLKLGRYADAIEAYTVVAKKYEPVFKDLEQTLVKQKDPVRYFNEIIAKNQNTYNAAAFLPPLAVSWVSEEREVARALGVAHDLTDMQGMVDDGKLIGSKVTGALQSKRPIELFPLYREGEERAVQLELELRKAFEKLLALLTQELGPAIDPGTRDKLAKAQTARIRAQAALAEAAFKKEESRRLESKQLTMVRDLDRQALRLRTEIVSSNAQLVALAKFLDESKNANNRAQIRELMDVESKVLSELEREERALRAELQQSQVTAGGPITDEQRARDDYASALATELQLLLTVRAKEGDAKPLRRLDALKDRLGSLDAGLRAFRDQLAQTVDHKTIQIGNAVAAELRLMQSYERELSGQKNEGEAIVGGVAVDSFAAVKKRFYDLVVKSDVGVMDVAWREKEDRTQKINDLVRTQKDALDALDRDFRELSEERGQ